MGYSSRGSRPPSKRYYCPSCGQVATNNARFPGIQVEAGIVASHNMSTFTNEFHREEIGIPAVECPGGRIDELRDRAP